MSQIVKNKGSLNLKTKEEPNANEEILQAIATQLLKVDEAEKGNFKQQPVLDALEQWDAEHDMKFSKAAKLEATAWAIKTEPAIRAWMRLQYMKRLSLERRNAAKTDPAPQPVHKKQKVVQPAKTVASAPASSATDARSNGKPPAKKPVNTNAPTHELSGEASNPKAQLVQRLSGMDESVLNAILSAANLAQTLTAGKATVTAAAGEMPAGSATIEESELERSSDDDEEAPAGKKKKKSMKAKKKKTKQDAPKEAVKPATFTQALKYL